MSLDKDDTEEEDVSLTGRKRKRKPFPDEMDVEDDDKRKRARNEMPGLLKPSRLLSDATGSTFSALTVVSPHLHSQTR